MKTEIHITDGSSDLYLSVEEVDDEAIAGDHGSRELVARFENTDWGYAGVCELIVRNSEWAAFTTALRQLFETLKGGAVIADDGSRIEFKSTNALGAIGVAGTLSIGTLSLQFDPIGIDSVDFEGIVKKIEAA